MRNYITKINDRNLQRKKASGITNYVLYSLLVLVIIKIADLLPKIPLENNIWSFIELLMYSSNFSLAIIFVYLSFLYSIGNTSSLRILKRSKQPISYFSVIIGYLIILFPVIPTFAYAWNQFQNGNTITFYHYVLIALNAFNIIFLISSVFTNKKKDNYSIFKSTKKNKDIKISILVLIISLAVIIISMYFLYVLQTKLSKQNVFMFGFLMFSSMIIVDIIIESYREDIYSKDLENLEYEIYVKDLNDEQIRHVLQTKYMGYLINDWINHKSEELKTELKSYKEIQKGIDAENEELNKIDKTKYPLEFEGREKIIKEKELNFMVQKLSFYEGNLKEIIEISKKEKSIELSELEKLNELREKMNEEFKGLK